MASTSSACCSTRSGWPGMPAGQQRRGPGAQGRGDLLAHPRPVPGHPEDGEHRCRLAHLVAQVALGLRQRDELRRGPGLGHRVDGPPQHAVGDRRGHDAEPGVGESTPSPAAGRLPAERAGPGQPADVPGCGQHQPARAARGASPARARRAGTSASYTGAPGGGSVVAAAVARRPPGRRAPRPTGASASSTSSGAAAPTSQADAHTVKVAEGQGTRVRLATAGARGTACRAGERATSRIATLGRAAAGRVAAADRGPRRRYEPAVPERTTTAGCSPPTAPARVTPQGDPGGAGRAGTGGRGPGQRVLRRGRRRRRARGDAGGPPRPPPGVPAASGRVPLRGRARPPWSCPPRRPPGPVRSASGSVKVAGHPPAPRGPPGSGWRACTTPSSWSACGVTTCGSRASSSSRCTAWTTSPRPCRRSGPAPQRRLGVLVDHLVAGSKETRAGARQQVAGPHVLVTGHPYVDVWEAVKPATVGIRALAAGPARHRLEDRGLRGAAVGRAGRRRPPGAGCRAQLPGPGDAADRRGRASSSTS